MGFIDSKTFIKTQLAKVAPSQRGHAIHHYITCRRSESQLKHGDEKLGLIKAECRTAKPFCKAVCNCLGLDYEMHHRREIHKEHQDIAIGSRRQLETECELQCRYPGSIDTRGVDKRRQLYRVSVIGVSSRALIPSRRVVTRQKSTKISQLQCSPPQGSGFAVEEGGHDLTQTMIRDHGRRQVFNGSPALLKVICVRFGEYSNASSRGSMERVHSSLSFNSAWRYRRSLNDPLQKDNVRNVLDEEGPGRIIRNVIFCIHRKSQLEILGPFGITPQQPWGIHIDVSPSATNTRYEPGAFKQIHRVTAEEPEGKQALYWRLYACEKDMTKHIGRKATNRV
ncbi:hypothetical protein EDD18DRAFT_1330362 [Armillaria luteobubalina]|uniref:Uncharacterized protein n=1 Tax=Armillaria luteobubalina TaxID=153913 RepID=A0AA39UR29_9AGAR|nr:hypothetical protein EDD18DRAFT_1330362 [Armillaria luteobubalina]